MKTAQQILKHLDSAVHRPLSDDSQRRPHGITPRTLEQLWNKMTSLYGHRWTSSFGESTDPDGVWARALEGVTPRQIADGLNAVVRSGLDWPPSAPEFRKLCLGGVADQGQGAYNGIHRQLKRPAHLLPKTTSAEDKARAKLTGNAALANLKKLFGEVKHAG